jgi:DinB family protein
VTSCGAGEPGATIRRLAVELRDEFDALLEWLDVDESVWTRSAAEGGWSVAEIAEHLALANHFLLILARKIQEKSLARRARGVPVPETPPRLEHLRAIAERSFRWQHPPHMAPSGNLGREELRRRLSGQRDACLGMLASAPAGEGSLHRIRLSVAPVGEADARLDLYQFLCFVGLHIRRHRAQMERIAKAPS